MPWYKNAGLWITVVVGLIMILQYIMNWPNNPVNWLFGEGLALAILNYILNWLQSQTVFTLKKIYPNWNKDLTLYKNKMNQPK